MRLSYIVPCYNLQKYVEKCIESLKKQTRKDIEFIFVNDGSTDDTLEQIKMFAREDNRVRVYDKVNEGVSKARNDGLKLAKGEYVFFLDGDDYVDNDASDVICNCLDSLCDLLILPHKKSRNGEIIEISNLGIFPGEYDLDNFLKISPSLPISYKVYKRDIIERNNIYFDTNLSYGEVYVFFFHYLSYCNVIKVGNFAVYNYVARDSSAIHKINREKELTFIRTINTIEKYSDNYGEVLKLKLIYHRPVFVLFVSMIFAKYVMNALSYSEVKDVFDSILHNDSFRRTLKKIALKESFRNRDKYVALGLLLCPHILYSMAKKIKNIR